MKDKTAKTVRFYYGIFFGIFTVVVGALFIWKTLEVYLTGIAPDYVGDPFTSERVVEALSHIALPFWLWIAGIVAGFVLWEVFPVKSKPDKICPDLQLYRLKKRMPETAPKNLSEQFDCVMSQERLIVALKVACATLCLGAAICFILYVAIPGHFTKPSNATQEIVEMVKNIFPAIFAAFLLCCGAAGYEKYSVKQQLPAVKKLAAGQKPQEHILPAILRERMPAVEEALINIKGALSNKWVLFGVRVALAVAAVTLIIIGATNGNSHAVFIKAINICTECIGLG